VLAAAASERPQPLTEREPDAPPDLAAIVEKAMELEAGRRYPTARELAEDLRRFLTGQLVSAHRYSPGQLLRRWVRHHRAAVTVAAVLGLALATAVAGSAVRRQARIAGRNVTGPDGRGRGGAGEHLPPGDACSADPRTSGKEVTVASILDRAAERLEEQLGEQPDVRASLQLTLGQTYQGLGLLDPAERLVRAALEARSRRHGADSQDVARARERPPDRGDPRCGGPYGEAIANSTASGTETGGGSSRPRGPPTTPELSA
jgi:hypothetical protein